ncbi:universal stress protein [Sinorhizobium terangae]|uniref:Universal stress protein n=1 Tax=Sinorhizobium terangae TaxID=110322 RepID=A0A6N7L907_SINTE|nr:universal stress protein [Sinorhizobium terangae]MBB4187011.1 nucleotide-binding universal stress UspA family protein [Sinorhizobium terangae]MQX14357.1 universal stress protein [Sinorhizobium terangae]WFU49930.1 universal stress protein [Sinorhizobium terangae]
MPFKTILTVTGEGSSDSDLQAAASLCGQVGAHLSVLVVAMAPPPPIGEYATVSTIWLEQRDRDREELEATVSHAREIISRTKVSFDISGVYAEAGTADRDIGERALYADLVLIGPSVLDQPDLKRQVINGSLFEAMRPILLVPAGNKPNLRPKTVLLAWDSRTEAAHAAREALDLMAAATVVHVTLVDPQAVSGKNGEEPGADVAAYLARHGINVTVDQLPSAGRSVASVLQQRAVDISADMIVMGAYGHSRVRELIFGGVTKTMLDEAAIPILMAR